MLPTRGRLALYLSNDARFEVHRAEPVYFAVNVMITVITNQANIAHFGTNFDRHRSALDLQIFDHRDRVAILQDVASGVFDYREFVVPARRSEQAQGRLGIRRL